MLALFQYYIQAILAFHCEQYMHQLTLDYSGIISVPILLPKLLWHNRPVPIHHKQKD